MNRMLILFLAISLWSSGYSEGQSPVAENLELSVYRNEAVEGMLAATDESDDTLRFTITTEPVKGQLLLREDGSFVYTPDKDRRGRDYFGYKAIDSEGNLSQEATVIIRIEKRGD